MRDRSVGFNRVAERRRDLRAVIEQSSTNCSWTEWREKGGPRANVMHSYCRITAARGGLAGWAIRGSGRAAIGGLWEADAAHVGCDAAASSCSERISALAQAAGHGRRGMGTACMCRRGTYAAVSTLCTTIASDVNQRLPAGCLAHIIHACGAIRCCSACPRRYRDM
jgi:hypothetical protein